MDSTADQGGAQNRSPSEGPKTGGKGTDTKKAQKTTNSEEQVDESIEQTNDRDQSGVGDLIDKSRILLFHGLEQGTDLKQEHIDAITEAINAYGTEDWTLDLEKRFYNAYSAMSKLSDGVSAEAIEHTRRYRLLYSFIIAFIGIVFLAYLVFQQNTFVRLQESTSSYDELTEQRQIKSQSFLQKTNELSFLERFNALSLTHPDKQAGPEAFGLTLEPEETTRQREDRISAEVAALEDEITRIDNQIKAQFRIISELMPVSAIDPVPERPNGWLFWSPDEAEMDSWRTELELWEQRQSEREVTDDFYGVQRAKTQIIFFNSYFLPALYGLLGTAAFVLRAFSRDLRSLSLQPVNLLNYLIRLPLGALSGIAVGLILIPDGTVPNEDAVAAAPEIAGLTTVALAFIAGYSVELLFTAMDRIVGAFGGTQTS